MDKVLKKRLVGTAVIVALAVIFLPMMLEGPEKEAKEVSMQISIPDRPSYDIPNRLAKTEPVSEPAVVEPVVVAEESKATASKAAESTKADAKETVVAQIPVVGAKPEAKASEPAEAKAKVVEVPAVAKPTVDEKPKSPASQIKTETSSAGFVIQVGSFSKQANADALKNRLAAAGYPAFVDASKLKNSDIFRVKVGPKPSRKQANQLRIELIDEEKLEGIIVRHP